MLWTTLLDPRFSLSSPHWRNDNEKNTAKKLLVQQIEKAAIYQMFTSAHSTSSQNQSSSESNDSEDDENVIDLFRTQDEQLSQSALDDSQELGEARKDRIRAEAKQEVMSYLMATDGIIKKKFNPLEWWRINKDRYPYTALVARKWLCVSATSTPSERVFSICGIVNSAKRSSLKGESIQDQVFVHNNYYKVKY